MWSTLSQSTSGFIVLDHAQTKIITQNNQRMISLKKSKTKAKHLYINKINLIFPKKKKNKISFHVNVWKWKKKNSIDSIYAIFTTMDVMEEM